MRGRAALPVLVMARSRPCGSCCGGGGGALYLRFPEGTVAVTSSAIPPMPNGIVVSERNFALLDHQGVATLSRGALHFGSAVVAWDDSDSYDLVIRRPRRTWEGLPMVVQGEDGLLAETTESLASALVNGDAERSRRAADRILGRGRGLTPEGDDVVTGAVATARALGIPRSVTDATLPDDIGSRTSSLSATLLRLALEDRVVEPLLRLLSEDGRSPESAARTLTRVGSSTGTSYLRAVVAVTSAHRKMLRSGGPNHR